MGGSYLDLYLSGDFPNNTPTSLLSLMFLSLARIMPIVTQASFFGGKVAPRPVKVALSFFIFVIFLPKLLADTKMPLEFSFELLFLFMKEAFIGFILGTLVSIPFTIVQNTGMLIDHQRGAASLMVNDPTIQNQSSPLGTMFNYLLIFFFYEMNGPFIFLDAVLTSFELVPVDSYFSKEFFSSASPFWQLAITLINRVMKISIQLAAPALLMILMTDVFLGIANRLAPQVQISFLGMPLKSLLALLIVTVGWQAFTAQIILETKTWLGITRQAVDWFAIGK